MCEHIDELFVIKRPRIAYPEEWERFRVNWPI
jgi:hypothetical protein